MRYFRISLLALLALTLLFSCKKEIKLNDDWQDITIVYGILNQQDSMHYLKITKAFLGDGNALQYAQISDSSHYMYKLNVLLEAWDDNNLRAIYRFDTTTIHDKDSGVFYFPNEIVYQNDSLLDARYNYKLIIRNPLTQEEIRSNTILVSDFNVDKPFAYQALTFDPGKTSKLEWISAAGGRLYQVFMRFYYREMLKTDTSQRVEKYVDWEILPGKQSKNDLGGEILQESYANDGFYAQLHASIPVNPNVDRLPRIVQYFFVVAGEDLNTYIEVTEPTNSIIQEKPVYSNIENGIGLFSSRYIKVIDSLRLSDRTKAELKVNSLTSDLGF